MQVILQEAIEGVGKAGQIVDVKVGYARNFLFPLGKALLANPHNVNELEHQKKLANVREAKLRAEAETFKKQLEALKLELVREAGAADGETEEKLFGSVTSKDVAELLTEKGVKIDRRKVQLSEPLKKLGTFDVPVKLHPEVLATLKVTITKK